MPRRADPNLVDSTSVTIRFPKKMHEWIKNRADKEKRSFNAQVLLDYKRLMEQQSGATLDPLTVAASGNVGKVSD